MSSEPTSAHERTGRMHRSPMARGLLEDLARRYYAPLLSFFRKRTHNPAEVQDLVQQVFLRLAQYRDIERIQNPDGYIFQTASNTLKDHYRYQATRENLAGLGVAEHTDFSPERILQGRENLARLADALRQLPERTRDILMLRCFEGLRHAEIAQLHCVSVRAVEKHMAKALVHLSRALDRDGRGGV